MYSVRHANRVQQQGNNKNFAAAAASTTPAVNVHPHHPSVPGVTTSVGVAGGGSSSSSWSSLAHFLHAHPSALDRSHTKLTCVGQGIERIEPGGGGGGGRGGTSSSSSSSSSTANYPSSWNNRTVLAILASKKVVHYSLENYDDNGDGDGDVSSSSQHRQGGRSSNTIGGGGSRPSSADGSSNNGGGRRRNQPMGRLAGGSGAQTTDSLALSSCTQGQEDPWWALHAPPRPQSYVHHFYEHATNEFLVSVQSCARREYLEERKMELLNGISSSSSGKGSKGGGNHEPPFTFEKHGVMRTQTTALSTLGATAKNSSSSLNLAIASGIQTLLLSKNLLRSLNMIIVFQNVTRLSLQANKISSLQELVPLQFLPRLEALSLAYNPITRLPNYRAHVIAICDRRQLWGTDGDDSAGGSKSNSHHHHHRSSSSSANNKKNSNQHHLSLLKKLDDRDITPTERHHISSTLRKEEAQILAILHNYILHCQLSHGKKRMLLHEEMLRHMMQEGYHIPMDQQRRLKGTTTTTRKKDLGVVVGVLNQDANDSSFLLDKSGGGDANHSGGGGRSANVSTTSSAASTETSTMSSKQKTTNKKTLGSFSGTSGFNVELFLKLCTTTFAFSMPLQQVIHSIRKEVMATRNFIQMVEGTSSSGCGSGGVNGGAAVHQYHSGGGTQEEHQGNGEAREGYYYDEEDDGGASNSPYGGGGGDGGNNANSNSTKKPSEEPSSSPSGGVTTATTTTTMSHHTMLITAATDEAFAQVATKYQQLVIEQLLELEEMSTTSTTGGGGGGHNQNHQNNINFKPSQLVSNVLTSSSSAAAGNPSDAYLFHSVFHRKLANPIQRAEVVSQWYHWYEDALLHPPVVALSVEARGGHRQGNREGHLLFDAETNSLVVGGGGRGGVNNQAQNGSIRAPPTPGREWKHDMLQQFKGQKQQKNQQQQQLNQSVEVVSFNQEEADQNHPHPHLQRDLHLATEREKALHRINEQLRVHLENYRRANAQLLARQGGADDDDDDGSCEFSNSRNEKSKKKKNNATAGATPNPFTRSMLSAMINDPLNPSNNSDGGGNNGSVEGLVHRANQLPGGGRVATATGGSSSSPRRSTRSFPSSTSTAAHQSFSVLEQSRVTSGKGGGGKGDSGFYDDDDDDEERTGNEDVNGGSPNARIRPPKREKEAYLHHELNSLRQDNLQKCHIIDDLSERVIALTDQLESAKQDSTHSKTILSQLEDEIEVLQSEVVAKLEQENQLLLQDRERMEKEQYECLRVEAEVKNQHNILRNTADQLYKFRNGQKALALWKKKMHRRVFLKELSLKLSKFRQLNTVAKCFETWYGLLRLEMMRNGMYHYFAFYFNNQPTTTRLSSSSSTCNPSGGGGGGGVLCFAPLRSSKLASSVMNCIWPPQSYSPRGENRYDNDDYDDDDDGVKEHLNHSDQDIVATTTTLENEADDDDEDEGFDVALTPKHFYIQRRIKLKQLFSTWKEKWVRIYMATQYWNALQRKKLNSSFQSWKKSVNQTFAQSQRAVFLEEQSQHFLEEHVKVKCLHKWKLAKKLRDFARIADRRVRTNYTLALEIVSRNFSMDAGPAWLFLMEQLLFRHQNKGTNLLSSSSPQSAGGAAFQVSPIMDLSTTSSSNSNHPQHHHHHHQGASFYMPQPFYAAPRPTPFRLQVANAITTPSNSSTTTGVPLSSSSSSPPSNHHPPISQQQLPLQLFKLYLFQRWRNKFNEAKRIRGTHLSNIFRHWKQATRLQQQCTFFEQGKINRERASLFRRWKTLTFQKIFYDTQERNQMQLLELTVDKNDADEKLKKKIRSLNDENQTLAHDLFKARQIAFLDIRRTCVDKLRARCYHIWAGFAMHKAQVKRDKKALHEALLVQKRALQSKAASHLHASLFIRERNIGLMKQYYHLWRVWSSIHQKKVKILTASHLLERNNLTSRIELLEDEKPKPENFNELGSQTELVQAPFDVLGCEQADTSKAVEFFNRRFLISPVFQLWRRKYHECAQSNRKNFESRAEHFEKETGIFSSENERLVHRMHELAETVATYSTRLEEQNEDVRQLEDQLEKMAQENDQVQSEKAEVLSQNQYLSKQLLEAQNDYVKVFTALQFYEREAQGIQVTTARVMEEERRRPPAPSHHQPQQAQVVQKSSSQHHHYAAATNSSMQKGSVSPRSPSPNTNMMLGTSPPESRSMTKSADREEKRVNRSNSNTSAVSSSKKASSSSSSSARSSSSAPSLSSQKKLANTNKKNKVSAMPSESKKWIRSPQGVLSTTNAAMMISNRKKHHHPMMMMSQNNDSEQQRSPLERAIQKIAASSHYHRPTASSSSSVVVVVTPPQKSSSTILSPSRRRPSTSAPPSPSLISPQKKKQQEGSAAAAGLVIIGGDTGSSSSVESLLQRARQANHRLAQRSSEIMLLHQQQQQTHQQPSVSNTSNDVVTEEEY